MPSLFLNRYARRLAADEIIPASSPIVFLLAGAALSVLAGCLLVRYGPLVALLAIAGTCGLALVARPFVALCGVVSLISLEALNSIQPNDLYSFTGVKVVGLILVVSLLPEVASQRIRLRLNAGMLVLGFFLLGIAGSFVNAVNTRAALAGTLTFAQLVVFYVAVQQLVSSSARLRILGKLGVATLVVSAVLALVQYFSDPEARVSGTSQNAAILAADLFVALGFGYALWATTPLGAARGIWSLLLLLTAAGVLVSLSRAAYLAFVPAVLVGSLFMRKGGRGMITLVVVALVLFLAAPFTFERMAETSLETDTSTRGHVNSLRAGVLMMADYPILGVGVGNYPEHYLQYTNDERGLPRSAHNSFLAIGAEMGVFALAAFVALHGLAFRALWRQSRAQLAAGDTRGIVWTGAIAFALTGFCFIGLFHALEISKYLWILLALALRPAGEPGKEGSP